MFDRPMRMFTIIYIGIIALVIPIMASADEEEPNRPIVFSGQHGMCYAKSIPDSILGFGGKTRIYSFEGWNDKLLNEYGWYSMDLELGGNDDRTIVRLFFWHEGHEPSDKQIAIGIYHDGKTIREYSTREIVKLGSGIRHTVSHYVVFSKRLGFRTLVDDGCRYVYEIEGVAGKLFAFDLASGAIIEMPSKQTGKHEPE